MKRSRGQSMEGRIPEAKFGTWQPIETAPTQDHIEVLLYRPNCHYAVATGYYEPQSYHKTPRPYWASTAKYWGVQSNRDFAPTHWMPLPDPPQPAEPQVCGRCKGARMISTLKPKQKNPENTVQWCSECGGSGERP